AVSRHIKLAPDLAAMTNEFLLRNANGFLPQFGIIGREHQRTDHAPLSINRMRRELCAIHVGSRAFWGFQKWQAQRCDKSRHDTSALAHTGMRIQQLPPPDSWQSEAGPIAHDHSTGRIDAGMDRFTQDRGEFLSGPIANKDRHALAIMPAVDDLEESARIKHRARGFIALINDEHANLAEGIKRPHEPALAARIAKFAQHRIKTRITRSEQAFGRLPR